MMFWQVYLHKTSVCAELMLGHVLERVRRLLADGREVPGSPALLQLLRRPAGMAADEALLVPFSALDDSDIWMSLKMWRDGDDMVLRELSRRLLDRRLFKSELSQTAFDADYLRRKKRRSRTRSAVWICCPISFMKRS